MVHAYTTTCHEIEAFVADLKRFGLKTFIFSSFLLLLVSPFISTNFIKKNMQQILSEAFGVVRKRYESASLSTFILLEVAIFAVCLHLVLPQRHRQARTVKLLAQPDHIVKLILDIERYPSWRSHVVGVHPLGSKDCIQFLEYVARTRHHLIHKQQPFSASATAGQHDIARFKTRARAIDMKLVDEYTITRRDRATRLKPNLQPTEAQLNCPRSSFEREWEITVRPHGDASSLLTLVETVRSEGFLARWLGPVLGFHRVSQRFLLDLSRELERQQKQRVVKDQPLCDSPTDLVYQEQQKECQERQSSTQELSGSRVPLESLEISNVASNNSPSRDDDDTHQEQKVKVALPPMRDDEGSQSSESSGRCISDEWDTLSEVYGTAK